MDKVIKQKLIPALFNDFQLSEELRSLIALPCKLGGRNCERRICKLARINQEINKPYYIIQQEHSYTVSEDEIKK